MNRSNFSICAITATLIAGGCGIPEQQYKSVLDEVKNLKAEMAVAQKACETQAAELTGRNKQLSDENEVMKTRLVSLGQNLSELKTKTGAMIVDLSKKEQQIADLVRAQEAAKARAAMFRSLVGKFQRMIDSGKLDVTVRKGRMIVQMRDQILFDPASAKLKPDGQEALLQVTQVLKELSDRHFQVAGHTDTVPIRSRRFKSNWELSTARAVNVVRFMADNGMDPSRLSAAGYGPFDPIEDNSTDEGRRMNRRIEITLMPSIEELPKIDTAS